MSRASGLSPQDVCHSFATRRMHAPPRAGKPPNPDGEANMAEDNDAPEKNATSTLIAAEQDLLCKAIELAKAGDGPMLKVLLDRSLPRERPVEIDLPQFEFADDAIDGLAAVTRAIADGEISPQEGAALSRVISGYSQALEVLELSNRIDKLEAQLKRKERI